MQHMLIRDHSRALTQETDNTVNKTGNISFSWAFHWIIILHFGETDIGKY